MIPLDKFKKTLGKKLEFTLNEEEILRLREVEDIISEAIFNMIVLPKITDTNKNEMETGLEK